MGLPAAFSAGTAPPELVTFGQDVHATAVDHEARIDDLEAGGGAVASVTGDTEAVVDNTDPANPVLSIGVGITRSASLATVATTGAYSDLSGRPTISGTNTGDQTITLTGDVTGSGTGSFATTLATVNSSPGSFGDASHSLTATVNAKGLITALSSQSIAIAESQVTSLVSDLAAKQPLDATLTALAAANWAANALPVGTGADTLSQTAFAANTFPARSSSGNLVAKTITDFGLSLVDDTDAATARTTLGLGTLATQSGTFSGTSSGTNTGDQTITLTGDVTGSGTGSLAATIANDAVTYAKMQNVSATSRVLGRITAGAGDPEELTGTNVRTIAGLATSDSPQFTAIELGHASDTTLSRASAGVLAVEGVNIVDVSSTQTLTNKWVKPLAGTTTSSGTPTINTDSTNFYDITAQAAAITSFTTNLSGTPVNGQKLTIRIKDNGTARAITWGTSFEACGVALPTTTTISKRLTVGFIYDTTTSKWGCVASTIEA